MSYQQPPMNQGQISGPVPGASTPPTGDPGYQIAPVPGAPHYDAPGAYGAPAPAPYGQTVTNGVGAWGMFLLLYIPIPVINVIVWIIATIVSYNNNRKRGGVAAGNARNAMNWMLTCVAVLAGALVLLAITTGIATAVTGRETFQASEPAVWPVFLLAALVILVPIFILINGIRGMIGAGGGRVVKAWPTIPFLREPRA